MVNFKLARGPNSLTGVAAPPAETEGAYVNKKTLRSLAGAETLRVFPNGCASCEADWLSRSKEAEDAEMARLEELRRENLPELGREIR